MPDLSQYLPLLSTTDDATIAGMAGCSVDKVAAFRAANAPSPAAPTPAEPVAPAAAPARARRATPSPAEPPPSAPPPPPKSVASYVADLSQADAEALYDALRERLHPAPAEQPAPHAVRSRGNHDATGLDGRLLRMRMRDVFTGDLARHLWTAHRKLVEPVPGA